MKKILVVYFTQSGQMKDIVHALCMNIEGQAEIDYAPITLAQPYPFPWVAYDTFFDAMPESVLGITFPVQPMPELLEKDYDLVILGYQPWYLSPSIPFNSFLQSEWAKVLSGKPVITVIGCRNMWLNAQEKVKQRLIELNASLVGNIALDDKNPNITSTLTIVRWMLKGQKEATEKAPEAGVAQKDIQDTARFGPTILDWLRKGQQDDLQTQLLAQGAIQLRPNLIVMEGNGARLFPNWANNARKLGLPGDPARQKVLKKFKVTLFISIFILSPLSGGLAKLKTLLQKKKITEDLAYFKQTKYIKGKIGKA
ncbi:dialkylrecorsinol condensing enzyme DarA [Taibaiella sp. KBW10]|uniref:dialkylrecorsinol condensing enzyme DarA n=1 Tax=Taibaiella sp. KBW10 TaxID=2153357 RepID=UPI000F59D808|nr:dialkylrecorsinol condensing enzyme DarA [Taibaiella sp. KBW10]RQO31670.1 dialkylrecorsinol condensing enzyme DarA [Taibaiella sp. KBW10]